MYNVRPCCSSSRVAVAVASELTGTYRADVEVFVHDNESPKMRARNNHLILPITLYIIISFKNNKIFYCLFSAHWVELKL
jgi:hypothetical protein